MNETENNPAGPLENYTLDDKTYSADLALMDRYTKFSSELLRISLLGFSAIGVLVKYGGGSLQKSGSYAHHQLVFASAFLGLCAAFSLAHRYFATDSMAEFISALRKEKSGRNATKEKDRVYFKMKFSGQLILFASVSLVLGIICTFLVFAHSFAQN
ncbi:MAG TPA: hypothetical protein VFU15_12885 [Bacteroidia bacterium]|nr:hypothetical protein [Bacteroidia bacterium]